MIRYRWHEYTKYKKKWVKKPPNYDTLMLIVLCMKKINVDVNVGII